MRLSEWQAGIQELRIVLRSQADALRLQETINFQALEGAFEGHRD